MNRKKIRSLLNQDMLVIFRNNIIILSKKVRKFKKKSKLEKNKI